MSTYTEHEQRQLDQASGDDLDRRASKFKCATCGDTGEILAGSTSPAGLPIITLCPCPACGGGAKPERIQATEYFEHLNGPIESAVTASAYLYRPKRSKEAVALDLAVDALAKARTALSLVSANPMHTYTHTAKLAIEKIDRALFGIAELRK